MKPTWSIVSCLVLLFTSVAHSEDDPAAQMQQSTWVTSIARIGETDQFAAGVAQGLLLRESSVNLFSANDPSTFTKIYSHPAAVWAVVASADGKTIASVDYRGNLVVFDIASKKATTHEKAFERWCQTLIMSADQKHLIAGNEAGKVFAWDLKAGKVAKSLELGQSAVTGLARSPDGKSIAASNGGGHIHLLQWPELTDGGKIEVSKETLWCVAYMGADKLIAGCSDRMLYQCEAKPGAKAESIAKGTDWITQIAISENGHVAAAEVGGRVHFPSVGGIDSMDAKSGIWSLCWNGNDVLFAGTRKDGIVSAGRSWKWSEAKKPEPDPEPEPEVVAEDKKEMTAETTKEPAAEPEKKKKKKKKEAEPKPEAAKAKKEAKPKAAKDAPDDKPAAKKE